MKAYKGKCECGEWTKYLVILAHDHIVCVEEVRDVLVLHIVSRIQRILVKFQKGFLHPLYSNTFCMIQNPIFFTQIR